MKEHNFKQGSAEWLAYRATMFNASDAPAMMGVSKHKGRNELLRDVYVGMTKDASWFQQKIYDAGHQFEALARSRAEEIVLEDLAPKIGSVDRLSASFDGCTLFDDVIWEHKTLNDAIISAQTADDLDEMYHVQVQQQLYVSGADKCLFTATKWDEQGNLINERIFWIYPDEQKQQAIIDGWAQFEKELSTYEFVEVIEPPKADAVKGLPSVTIQVRGELTMSNLNDVVPYFDAFLANAKTELLTDDDFAQAEAESKVGRETAKNCKLTAKQVIDQIQTVSDAVKTLEHYAAKFDALALMQEKAVKDQKDMRKAQAKLERDALYSTHIAELEKTITPIRLVLSDKPDFVGVMKNQRTLSSIYNKLDTELARARIIADNTAKDIADKLAWIKDKASEHRFLFNDIQQIIYKDFENFEFLVNTRITQYQEDERQRIEKAAADQKAMEDARLAAEIKSAAEVKPKEIPSRTPESLRQSADRIETSAAYSDDPNQRQREIAEAGKLRREASVLEESLKTVVVALSTEEQRDVLLEFCTRLYESKALDGYVMGKELKSLLDSLAGTLLANDMKLAA